jgi:hypothetical protein
VGGGGTDDLPLTVDAELRKGWHLLDTGTLSSTASVTSTGSVDLDPSDNSATDVDTIQ